MVTKEHTEHLKALHRSVFNDWGLYSFVQMLEYKCALAGKALLQIDERETSKTCSRCGHTQPMPLYKRTYRCLHCGLLMDRDQNSAVNLRERFAFPAPVHTRLMSCGVRTFSPQSNTFEHVLKGRREENTGQTWSRNQQLSSLTRQRTAVGDRVTKGEVDAPLASVRGMK